MGKTVVFQNSLKTGQSESLFYTTVSVQNTVELQGMLDSGSMATTLRADVIPQLKKPGVFHDDHLTPSEVILVGCRR